MECSSALNGFGIPTDRLPLKYDGSIKLDDHLQWIAVREAKEEAHRQGKAFDVIECPLNMDILAGEWKIWGGATKSSNGRTVRRNTSPNWLTFSIHLPLLRKQGGAN